MRKHNEGYALVLVLVVLVVLCLLSSYLLSFSLRNLNNQKMAANRLQDQYTAAGQIEQTVGSIQAFIKNVPQGTELTATVDPENGKLILETQGEEPARIEVPGAAELEADRLNLALVFSSETVRIDCVVQLEALAIKDLSEENLYKLTNLTGVEYVSYKVSIPEEVDGE